MMPVRQRIRRFHVGRWTCYAIQESAPTIRQGLFTESLVYGALERAPSGGSARFDALRVAATTARTCVLACAEAPRQRILLEVGAGQRPRSGWSLLAALGALGVDPAEIDVVLLSHAHPGHVGGALTPDGRLAVPRARHVLARQEWEFWQAEADAPARGAAAGAARAIRGLLAAIGARLELVARGQEVALGIQALAAPGHTAGHLAYSLVSEGEHLLSLGDAVLHPLHLAHPEWSARGDLRPEQAMASRIRLLDRAVAATALVHAYHAPFPALGYVIEDGLAWRWAPVPTPKPISTAPLPI
jgi:glyoxylase-like metal-dependent hydrolase (beta-lactamase superfamily II)